MKVTRAQLDAAYRAVEKAQNEKNEELIAEAKKQFAEKQKTYIKDVESRLIEMSRLAKEIIAIVGERTIKSHWNTITRILGDIPEIDGEDVEAFENCWFRQSSLYPELKTVDEEEFKDYLLLSDEATLAKAIEEWKKNL